MATVKSTKAKSSSKKLKASKKKPLNKWIILGGVAAVAIIGAVVVRFSSASSYTFVRHINKRVNNAVWAKTTLSSAELKKSDRVCAHYTKVGSLDRGSKLLIGAGRAVTYLNQEKMKSSGNICVKLMYVGRVSPRDVYVYVQGSSKYVKIDTIYGKK